MIEHGQLSDKLCGCQHYQCSLSSNYQPAGGFEAFRTPTLAVFKAEALELAGGLFNT